MNFRKNSNRRERKASRVAVRALANSVAYDDDADHSYARLDFFAQRAEHDKRRWGAKPSLRGSVDTLSA